MRKLAASLASSPITWALAAVCLWAPVLAYLG
jgi:hypothetical protein